MLCPVKMKKTQVILFYFDVITLKNEFLYNDVYLLEFPPGYKELRIVI